MSRFDLDKRLAAIDADLDAAIIERFKQALTAAVDDAEREAQLRASEATQGALGGFRRQLEALEAKAVAQSTEGAQSLVERHRAALEGLEAQMKRTEQDAASVARSVANEAKEARAVEDEIRDAAQSASKAAASAEQTRDAAIRETSVLRDVQQQTTGLMRKARLFLIAGVVFALLGLLAAGWVGGLIGQQAADQVYATEFARLAEEVQAHEDRIAELVIDEEAAFVEADRMATTRDRIRGEMNRITELQDEIGLEVVRDSRGVVEIKLGDVMLRPWRGRTLVIIDEGRQLEAFSGGAALNYVARYRGRMFRTQPAG
jgi:hypothetical protein